MNHVPATIGRYQVLREIARGGMGAVYEVKAPGDPRRLALKMILGHVGGEELERFMREAELMAKVRHPNLIGIHVLEQTPRGQPYMISDLVEGETLTELVRRERPDPERVKALISGVCLGLEALHRAGILHRDLKPDNVLVRPDGRPLLLDFGIARELDAETLTQTGALLGTPGFMAPEQARAGPSRELDPRTDVYGAGALLYYLLARRAPHEGLSLTQVLLATVESPVDWGPTRGAPSGLVEAARRALSKDPSQRQESAAVLREELSAAGLPGARRSAPWVGAGFVALLALASSAYLLLESGLEPSATPRGRGPSASATQQSSRPRSRDDSCQVLEALHRSTQAAPGSGRLYLASNSLFLFNCGHSGKLRLIQRDPEGETWRDLNPIRIPRGASVAYPQDADYSRAPPWAFAWERVSAEFVGVDLRARSAKEEKLVLGNLNALAEFPPKALVEKFGQVPIRIQHVRSSDGDLLTAFASSPSARGSIGVFELNWEKREVSRYRHERVLRDAPANVRDMTNLARGTCAAVGEGLGGPPLRIWFIGPDQTAHSVWPYAHQPVTLPTHAGTAVVGLELPRERFVLWGDQGGGLHVARWRGPPPESNEAEGSPANVSVELELDRLPGPVLGLALVWRKGQLLVFAASGAASRPEQWSRSEANELRVYALSLAAKESSLVLRARRSQRPLAYTSLKVSHDGRWLLGARADCSLEAWSVAELLGEE